MRNTPNLRAEICHSIVWDPPIGNWADIRSKASKPENTPGIMPGNLPGVWKLDLLVRRGL